MSRIACIRIPKFQIVVHQKQDPELKGKPFVLIGGRSRVWFCSDKASRNFVLPGMRLSQARGTCANLLWRDYEQSMYLIAQKSLVSEMVACSPRVSSSKIGEIILDAEGLTHIGGEGKFCRDLLRLASKNGYTDGYVGVADSAFAASIAAQQEKRRWLVIPSGKDVQFLSEVSTSYLPLNQESQETLQTLGINTIGQFRNLTVDEIRHKFGVEGEKAYKLASGLDDTRPSLPLQEKSFQCLLDLGGPIESLTDTIFVFKSLLNRLVSQLVSEGICAEELTACFYNDNDLFEERPIKLVKPSNNSKFLLEVLRLSLESKPLVREFTAIRLVISKTAKEAFDQLEINEAANSETSTRIHSDSFAFLLQRLETRLGEGALVKPVKEDQYFPELAGNWQPIELGRHQQRSKENQPDYAFKLLNGKGIANGLVFKRFHRPYSALVELQNEEPVTLTFDGSWYRVIEITVPEKLSGLWWESNLRRSYYTALLQDRFKNHLLVMLVLNDQTKSWSIEGVYD